MPRRRSRQAAAGVAGVIRRVRVRVRGRGSTGRAPPSGANSAASVPVSQACAPSAAKLVEQGGAARARRDGRRPRRAAGSAAVAVRSRAARARGEHDADQQRLLLAGRAVARPAGRSRVAHDEDRCGAGRRRRRRSRRHRRGPRRARRRSAPRPRAPACSSSQLRPRRPTASSRPRKAAGRALGAARSSRATAWRRAAATATPAAPCRRSSASSQAGSPRPSRKQPRALAQRMLVGARRGRHGRDRSRAPAGRGSGAAPTPVQNSRSIVRRQPDQADQLGERVLAARRRRRRCGSLRRSARHPAIAAGADLAGARDGPRPSPPPPSGPPARRRSSSASRARAQAPAGGEKRDRLQQIGLAGAVRPGQHHRPAATSSRSRRIGAEVAAAEYRAHATRRRASNGAIACRIRRRPGPLQREGAITPAWA